MANHVLNRWGVILVEGEDAATFLHAQLSNGVKDLDESNLRLAAFCTAKGRILGSFFMVRRRLQVFLICPVGTIPALSKRLSMFILRSKCKARDFSAECTLQFVARSGLERDMSARWQDEQHLELALRPLQGVRPGLLLTLGGKPEATEVHTVQPIQNSLPADAEFEHALHGLGLPYVVPETVEMFIPQAVNLDLVGGVNFEKGCYPGQEIVARSHYLGKSKRRAFLAELPAVTDLKAGVDIWLVGKDNEPIGNVITCTTLNSKTYLMVDCTLEDGLNPESRFELRLEGTTLTFGLQVPPYDVQSKGNQFND